MSLTKNLPHMMQLAYNGYNRALPLPHGGRGEFQPVFNYDGSVQVTFCNEFINFICSGLNYLHFEGLLANEMFDLVNNPKQGWISVDETVAQAHANEGILVLAAHKNPTGHGHLAIIVPGLLEKSLNFGKLVPVCANVGRDVFFGKKISFAFKVEDNPHYFALAEMI